MAMDLVLGLGAGAGLPGSVTDVVALAGAVVLVLMILALAGVAYKGLAGDGIEWPDDREAGDGGDEVHRGDSEDEWKYY